GRAELAALAEFQALELTDLLLELRPDAAVLLPRLLEQVLERVDLARIHRVVVGGQGPAVLRGQMGNADHLVLEAKRNIANQTAVRVEDVIRMVDARGDRTRHLRLAYRGGQVRR